MNRDMQRRLFSIASILLGAIGIYKGNEIHPKGLPGWLIGIILVVVGVLGLCGVNVYRGGPLDKDKDSK
jgi:hypothetical protein